MKLEEKLALLRKEKGLTQLELAEEMDISRQAVSRWETGATVPTMDNLIFLSGLYGVTMDYLLNDGKEKSIQAENALGEKPEEVLSTKFTESAREGFVISKKLAIKVIAILLAMLLSLVLIYTTIFKKDSEEILNMEEIDRKEMLTEPNGNFSIGW